MPEQPPRTPSPVAGGAKARLLGKVTLAVWTVCVLTFGAFLMASHAVSLPVPAAASQRITVSAPNQRTGHESERRWSTRHVLYQGCGCSARVLEHLVKRGARPDLDESVVYVRDHDAAPDATAAAVATASDDLKRAGFQFASVTPLELQERYHIESAPLLTVFDPSGEARYVGGYTDQSGAGLIHDLDIIEHARSGQAAKALPVFGCAISKRVQKAIDPLGLKY